MNIQHIHQSIAVLERVKERKDKFDMGSWSYGNRKRLSAMKEAEYHSCGMAACFGGWLAVSPEWAAAGGTATVSGMPKMSLSVGEEAIAKFLDISQRTAANICAIGTESMGFYGVTIPEEITVSDVINKLKELIQSEQVHEVSKTV